MGWGRHPFLLSWGVILGFAPALSSIRNPFVTFPDTRAPASLTPVLHLLSPHYFIETFHGEAPGFSLGYGDHCVRLAPDPEGKVAREALKVLRKYGRTVPLSDYRKTLRELAAGDLDQPIVPFVPDEQIPAGCSFFLEQHLPNGVNLVGFGAGGRIYLEIGVGKADALILDATEAGGPLQQAIWALEPLFPDKLGRRPEA